MSGMLHGFGGLAALLTVRNLTEGNKQPRVDSQLSRSLTDSRPPITYPKLIRALQQGANTHPLVNNLKQKQQIF